jgi:HEAT repeat protein
LTSRAAVAAILAAVPAATFLVCCRATPSIDEPSGGAREQHLQRVMSSRFCADCHPDIYAEHEQNTHGRAFTDEEVRLATGRFSQGDCIVCHTPRPIFETGIGMNPMRRHYGLEEGNSCMTCHWRPEQDYSTFRGGAECKTAFDPRVGEVEACASCHRNHGTPYQWELAPKGKAAGRTCVDCHMAQVVRPVAVGQQPRRVRSHQFPGSRSEEHLRRAYTYDARIDGSEVVVRIENRGAGHNFPTELKQRSVESLVIVRDAGGAEVGRSRMVFRDPYKRPYGLHLPINTQIPSGQAVEHRVPLPVASGSVDAELHFKLYFPIEDHHPDLARRLEARKLLFDGITPSDEPIPAEPDVPVVLPEGVPVEAASPADLIDFARPQIGKVAVEIPAGEDAEDIAKLIELFQFPVPEANGRAQKRLAEIGPPAVPALIDALGSWDNKTWNQAAKVLATIGRPALPAVAAALTDDRLYVRVHAREWLARTGFGSEHAGALLAGLRMAAPLDRASAAEAIGRLGLGGANAELRRLLGDADPDVVRAGALALARLDDRDAVPELRRALARAAWFETQVELAYALGALGEPAGMQVLLQGLDHRDDLLRESAFERWFALTGQHAGFDPLAPRDVRLAAIAELQRWWAPVAGPAALRRPRDPSIRVMAEVEHLVAVLGGGAGPVPAGDDAAVRARLLELGADAVPGLVAGLKYPAGFADKRALVCSVLGEIGDPGGVPALVAALRDPVVAVAAWACHALERIGDAQALAPLQRYQSRILTLAAAGRIPASAGSPELLLSQVASARLALGEAAARTDLVRLLLADDVAARRTAIAALQSATGDARGYDPEAEPERRREMAARWLR